MTTDVIKALVFVADGSEEIETITPIDILTRAGAKVTVISVSEDSLITCACHTRLKAEPLSTLASINTHEYRILILPGGSKGAMTLSHHPTVLQIIREMYNEGKLIAAICAGSLAINAAQIAKGRHITSHPSVKEQLVGSYQYEEGKDVVHDGNLITSRGPGTALPWALEIVETVFGKKTKMDIADNIIYSPQSK